MRWTKTATLTLLLGGFGAAQSQDDDLSSLRHGHLVVWMVRSATVNNPAPAVAAQVAQGAQPAQPAGPPGYGEKTVAELGQSASTFGHDAGSYGLPSDTTKISTAQSPPGADAPVATSDDAGYHEQTSGSFGQPASDYGKTAGSYGHTASSVGQTAGSYGQTAGSYGQTASSLGNSLSTIADAGHPKQPSLDWQSKWKKDLQTKFPQLRVDYVDVDANDLRSNLRLYENKPGYPDVLMGQTAGSYGQTAGSYGQPASSLGNSLSTIADAAKPKQPPLDWQSKWKKDLQTKFPQLRVDYVDVDANDLRSNLRLYENKPGYPDVLMGQLPATWKPETTSRYLTSVTGSEAPNSIGVQASSSHVSMFFPPVFVLARARHLPVAQAFVLWINDDEQKTVAALSKQ